MKKIVLCILAGLFSSTIAFAQSAERLESILQSKTATCAQASYLAAVHAELISENESVEKAFDALLQDGCFSSADAADNEISLAQACYIYAKSLNIKGGLFYTLFPSKRYAFKELKAKNIIPRESDPSMKISGRDSIDLFTSCLALVGE